MRQNVSEVIEHARAELHNIVAAPAGPKIADDILAEVGRKLKGVIASIASEQVVARTAHQVVVARRAQDNAPRNWIGLPGAAVRNRRREAMYDVVR